MTTQHPATLTATERLIKGLIILNVLYGAGILLLLIASIAAPDMVFTALTRKPALGAGAAIHGMRLLMIAGVAAVPVTHAILARLRTMLLTVRAGDPFVVENARRLNEMAIAVLVLELLHLGVGVIVNGDTFAAYGIRINWSFSLTPWVAVLLLFVLAQVFEHGARMRADLEGTI